MAKLKMLSKLNKFENIFFAKIALNCNENDLCTKIQIDLNIFVENNDF